MTDMQEPVLIQGDTTLWWIALIAVILVALVFLFFWFKGRRLPGPHAFRASRWSRGNMLLPTQVVVSPGSVLHYKPELFGGREQSIHINHISSVLIDRNFMDVGQGSRPGKDSKPCGTTQTFKRYATLRTGAKGDQVKAMECLLKKRGLLTSADQRFGIGTARAVDAYRAQQGLPATGTVTRATWTSLLSAGRAPRVLKQGSVGPSVWRLQRSLVAAGMKLPITGLYDARTVNAVRAYRTTHGLPGYTTTEATVWALLQAGRTASR